LRHHTRELEIVAAEMYPPEIAGQCWLERSAAGE
jgi:hypothetical protein